MRNSIKHPPVNAFSKLFAFLLISVFFFLSVKSKLRNYMVKFRYQLDMRHGEMFFHGLIARVKKAHIFSYNMESKQKGV